MSAESSPAPASNAPVLTRALGDSTLMASEVGLGCNTFGVAGTGTPDAAGVDRLVGAALELGVTTFDTADYYGMGRSEELLGEVLGARRDQIVLATKFGMPAPGAEAWGSPGSRAYVHAACEASLRRLRTDRIDLYQMHQPDPEVPMGETLAALDELVTAGKVLAIGHSNFSADQIREADWVAAENGTVAFVIAQDNYSLLAREVEAEVLPAVVEEGLGFLPYFPLASGLLTGKYSATDRPAGARLTERRPERLEGIDWERLERFRSLCASWGAGMAQVSIAWLLAQPGVACVIAGATRPEQLADNAAASGLALPDGWAGQVAELFAD